MSASAADAEQILRDAGRAGVDVATITAQLEREGVQSFCASYQQLLDRIESKPKPPSSRPPSACADQVVARALSASRSASGSARLRRTRTKAIEPRTVGSASQAAW